ncbi:MAG TPA: thioredoxin family protein [Bacteroidota bacterium]|nr:thioredoxin family protein [Bacteroidota bacterium]
MRTTAWIAALLLMWTSVLAQGLDEGKATLQLPSKSITAAAGSTVDVQLTARIAEQWHVNSNTPNEDFLIPSVVTARASGIRLIRVRYPEAKDLALSFADKPVSVYEGDVVFGLTFTVAEATPPGKQNAEITLSYQACNDKTCMPPSNATVTLVVDVTPAVPAESPAGSQKGPGTDGGSDSREASDVAQAISPAAAPSVASGVLQGGDSTKSGSTRPVGAAGESSISLAVALLFAFLGGMILNLMPCVLPVLSLKIMGMVKQAGEAPRERLKHGALFTFGVVASFWVLAGIMLLLQAGGEQLGWGFQLQSPSFVIVLSIFLFLFGLSMFGVFEIGTSLTGVGQGVAGGSSYTSSLISGVLATTVATPCTAPFMGSALGFTLGAPAYVAFLVFTFVGLGMAAPYLLLTTIPALLKFIPKPGAWMESMKQFMGFLLIATVLWLIWVLSLQTGADGVVILLAALLLVALGGWIFGRWGNIAKEKPTRRIAQVIALVAVAGGLFFSLTNIKAKEQETAGVHRQGSIEWLTYTPELVEGLKAEGRTVFLDFTAAWCLSCQVNEKVAFSSEEVQNEFARRGIATVRADWTNHDETITRALAAFGRNSVPLYVLYAPGKDPVLLPEIITPGIVLEALRNSTSGGEGAAPAPSSANP